MKDDYTFSCTCLDGSTVQYSIEDGVKMVFHWRNDGTRWKAEYERGGWINF